MMSLRFGFAISGTLLCAGILSAASGGASPTRLWIAGNEKTVWVAEQRGPASGRTVRLYYGDRDSVGVFTTPTLPDRVGDIAGFAVDESDATILYSDGTVDLLTFRATLSGPRWPSDRPPYAWCGDATRPDVYALGNGEHIVLPSKPKSKSDRRSSAQRGAASQPDNPVPPGLTLMRLHHGAWGVVGLIPPAARNSREYWVSARDDRVYLFWRPAAGRSIECASFADGGWSDPAVVPETEGAVAAWASADAAGPILAVCYASGDVAEGCRLRVAWRGGKNWHISGPLGDGDGELLIDPAKVSIGVARGRLSIARLTAGNALELGQSSLDGDRAVTWAPTALLGEGPALTGSSANWSWIETLTLMVVMTAIIWTRQDSLTQPVSLPQSLMISPPIRRIAALLIDLLPVVLLSGWLWVGPIKESLLLWPRLMDDPRLSQSLWTTRVLPAWYFVAVVYAAYCGTWEWFSGTTPGKHFLGCRVVAAGGEKPDRMQIIARNCLRIPELGLPLAGMFSVFLMAVISRNHQRIGDVVAGTYVVSAAPPMARPVGVGITARKAAPRELD